MKKILIVSATSKSNLNLAKDLNGLGIKLGAASKIISLEKLNKTIGQRPRKQKVIL